MSYKTPVVLLIVKASKSLVSDIENEISILKRKDSMLLTAQPMVTLNLVTSLIAASIYHASIVNRNPPITFVCVPMHTLLTDIFSSISRIVNMVFIEINK